MSGAFQSDAFQAEAFQRDPDDAIHASLSAQQTGAYGAAASGAVTVGVSVAAQQAGAYSAAASVDVAVSGDLEAQQTGAYQASADIDVIVRSPGAFQGTAFQLGAFQRADQTSATLHAQIGGGYSASVSGEVDIVGDLDAGAPGPYVSAIHGGPIAASALSVRQVGSYAAAAVVAVTVAASLTAQIVGSYAAAVSAKVPVVGHLATQQTGTYQSGTSGVIKVAAALTAQQTGAYNDQFVADVEDGYLRVRMVGAYGADLHAGVRVDTALAVQQVGPYTAASDIDVQIHGGLAVQQLGAYSAQFGSVVKVAGALEVQQVGFYKFNGTGSSSAYVPRDPALGLLYLVEIDGYKDGEVTTFRFAKKDFNTRPTDNPSNAHYAGRLKVPGNFSRSLFNGGATNGQATVGYGTVELNNEGALDYLDEYAFDGRKLKILSLERRNPIYTRALTLFEGTVARAPFTLDTISFHIRDRLTEIDRSIQTTLYAGTTTAGGMNEAEGGPDDLKNQPKPLTFGSPKNVSVVASNTFDLICDLGVNGLQSVAEVRDKGVALTPTGNDYSTVAALRTAMIASGRYSTALNLGLIRTGSKPVGRLTASPVQGANAAARTAAQVARSILLRMGMTENVDFLASDVSALDTVNNAVVGLWTGTDDVSGLSLVSQILNSIAASISPDRKGVYRMVQIAPPSGDPELTITKNDIVGDTNGIERVPTDDQGGGVEAWKINVRYARNYTVMTAADLDPVSATAAFKAFAEQEWRVAVASDDDVLTAHPLATEITIDTCLQSETDAQAMADFWLDLYSVQRKRFRVSCKSVYVERIDLSSVVRLQLNRFGMDAGKDFRVIGIDENYEDSITVLDLWG